MEVYLYYPVSLPFARISECALIRVLSKSLFVPAITGACVCVFYPHRISGVYFHNIL